MGYRPEQERLSNVERMKDLTLLLPMEQQPEEFEIDDWTVSVLVLLNAQIREADDSES